VGENSEHRTQGQNAYLKNKDRRIYVAASAVGEEVVDVLYEEQEVTAEEITDILDGKGLSANPRFVNRLLGLLETENYIDLEQKGPLHAATSRKYASNGVSREDVVEFVKGYEENARTHYN